MAKFHLENEFDYELMLIGISSHARDYRLCWALNSVLRLKMVKHETGIVQTGKNSTSLAYPLFEYEDDDTRVFYSLIANKSQNTYLVPELKHADYLLMLRNPALIDLPKLLDEVRSCDQVLTAFEIPVADLKSRDNLIYF